MSKDPFNFNFPFLNTMPEDIGDPNLILDSMKMMSQAWQNFATMAPQSTAMAMDPNELDKRIEELKAVESWLKLNLSMLSSSIHSLEIQKSNLQNFSSFMEMMSEPMKATQAAAAQHSQPSETSAPAPQKSTEASSEAETENQATSDTADEASQEQPSFTEASELVQEQALNWFNLLGDQFKNIVASVASATPDDTAETKEQAEAPKTPAKKASKKAAKKSASKKSSKTTAKKTSATKKTTAKKTAVKKSISE
jgi:hypothetical protein